MSGSNAIHRGKNSNFITLKSVCVCVCEYGGNNNKKEEEEKKYCAQWCLVCIQQLFNVTILWKLKRRINHKYCIVLTGAVLTTR